MKEVKKFPPPDSKFAYWHGIPREQIPWYPSVDEEKCIGCKLCFVSCGRNVFDFDVMQHKAVVTRPYNCMVGCSTCATICPSRAISFPEKEIVHKIEKEFHIIGKIQKKALEKKYKLDLERVRRAVLDDLSKVKVSRKYELVGHFFDRNVINKIREFLEDKDCDIVDLHLELASIKGCFREKAPSVLKFTLVSTKYGDISECEKNIEKILDENKVIIANKS